MPENPFTPQLDLELSQWKRDIQTFIASMLNELTEISDQLSADFAEPLVRRSYAMENESGEDAFESSGSDRLARLKEKLAQKVK